MGRLVSHEAMEFGLFVQAHVPLSEMQRNPAGAEHDRLMREADLAVACDAWNFKYVWSVEHHFLHEYSHISASEIFLPWIAARTKRLHVGSAIYNITPPVNHPARMAERVAMLDHLSEGRFEFGTGRGSSSTEFKGFGIPDGDTTRAMYDEALPEIVRMWKTDRYSFEGRYFSMPERNVLPKPYSKPHPPLWVACGSPSTFEKAGRLGLGALCFSLGSPKDFEPLIKTYKNAVRNAEPVGDYVNDNVVCVSQLVCHEDGKKARAMAMNMGSGRHQSLVFRYLDTFPKPPQVPDWPKLIPDPTAEQLEERIATGQRIVGTPDECATAVQKYVDVGCDQIVFGVLATTLPQADCLKTCELFGTQVIPRFDADPVHSTTRYREAALARTEQAAAQ
jgi:alkanesulfonate monooxygenase SsuD/methylene tetrahydromethanopterin reductase-like flavin-dependent oxidoreductase (luciferase family)